MNIKMIDIYCNKCRCSTRIFYNPIGDSGALVLNDILIKCHTCKLIMIMKNYQKITLRKL